MVAELTKAGVDVEETDDGMIVRGGAKPHGAAFETYKDHRIAMSLAVLGLAAEGASRIDEPEVVAISPTSSPRSKAGRLMKMLLSMEEFRAFQPKKADLRAVRLAARPSPMSPELHAQLFEASGQDAAYIGVAVPPDDLAEAFDLAKAKLRGINCTIPHKKAVIELLDGVDTAARDLHSVNTVAFRDGKAIGYNTDILGFSESLVRDGVTLRGKKALLLGYGGAASVMAYHCACEGACLTITGRNLEKAAALQQQIAETVPHARVADTAAAIPRDIQIVLNSTPVGMYPKENLAPLHYLPHKTEYVFDAIYNPPVTATMRLANPRKTATATVFTCWSCRRRTHRPSGRA